MTGGDDPKPLGPFRGRGRSSLPRKSPSGVHREGEDTLGLYTSSRRGLPRGGPTLTGGGRRVDGVLSVPVIISCVNRQSSLVQTLKNGRTTRANSVVWGPGGPLRRRCVESPGEMGPGPVLPWTLEKVTPKTSGPGHVPSKKRSGHLFHCLVLSKDRLQQKKVRFSVMVSYVKRG